MNTLRCSSFLLHPSSFFSAFFSAFFILLTSGSLLVLSLPSSYINLSHFGMMSSLRRRASQSRIAEDSRRGKQQSQKERKEGMVRGKGDVGGKGKGRCRRRAAKKDPTSAGGALKSWLMEAVKTEICLSEASLFPFRRKKTVLAREGAVLIFASFHQGKEGATLHKGKGRKKKKPPLHKGRSEKEAPPSQGGKKSYPLQQGREEKKPSHSARDKRK